MEPTLRFHDFRRSAARNLDRAGVSQAVAMKVTGHATDLMWRRYRIVDESDIEQALKATQVYIGEQVAKTPGAKVVSLSEARR